MASTNSASSSITEVVEHERETKRKQRFFMDDDSSSESESEDNSSSESESESESEDESSSEEEEEEEDKGENVSQCETSSKKKVEDTEFKRNYYEFLMAVAKRESGGFPVAEALKLVPASKRLKLENKWKRASLNVIEGYKKEARLIAETLEARKRKSPPSHSKD